MQNINKKLEEEIVHKGDANLPFNSNEEIRIYLKHLIANKDSYIKCASEYEGFELGAEELNLKKWELYIKIISVSITILAIGVGLTGFICGSSSAVISALQIIGAFDIPTTIFLITSGIIRKKAAVKKVNNKISDLKQALSLEETTTVANSLKEIKDLIKTTTRTYSKDAYIANIQKDMEIVASIKYAGYEKDLETLYNQAETYLKIKKENITSSPTDVLTTEWFKPLIEIENKIRRLSKVEEDQTDIIAALGEMREILIRESSKPTEEVLNSGYTPTLKL